MGSPEKKDVLVVDDDRGIRTLVATSLKRLGVTCDTAADGADALEHISRISYSVVLVDLMMPRIDGTAFVIELREREKNSGDRPVVLMMTAFPIREAPHLGEHVQVLIQKPFDVIDLAELVRDCVETLRLQTERRALNMRESTVGADVFGSSPPPSTSDEN